jgi:hypothetical protein
MLINLKQKEQRSRIIHFRRGVYACFRFENSRPIESSKDWADQGRFYQRFNSIFDGILNSGKVIQINEREAKLITDVAFKSSSAAASICSGYAESGYEFWIGLKAFKSENESNN